MPEINISTVISKLCPRVKTGRMVTLDNIADDIAEQSGFDRGDVRDLAYKFGQGLIKHLVLGDGVKLGELGLFKIACDKNKKLRVSYRASKEIKQALLTQFEGEFINGANAALDDLGFAKRWLTQNPTDTVLMRDGTRLTAADF